MTTDKQRQGLVQVYTGNGKGKTTAAFGLSWRMLGCGGKVYICQFLKPAHISTGEAELAGMINAKNIANLTLERADYDWDMAKSRDLQQRQQAATKITKAIDRVKTVLSDGQYDLVILDEIIVCYSMKLVEIDTIKELTKLRQSHTELVMTGRGADDQICALAGLVTEMKEIKHPFISGIPARKGIDF